MQHTARTDLAGKHFVQSRKKPYHGCHHSALCLASRKLVDRSKHQTEIIGMNDWHVDWEVKRRALWDGISSHYRVRTQDTGMASESNSTARLSSIAIGTAIALSTESERETAKKVGAVEHRTGNKKYKRSLHEERPILTRINISVFFFSWQRRGSLVSSISHGWGGQFSQEIKIWK